MANVGQSRVSQRYRLLVTLLIFVFTAGLAISSTLLLREANSLRGTGSILLWFATGVLVVLSGVAINELPRAILSVWRDGHDGRSGLLVVAQRLGRGFRRPLRAVGVIVVAALTVTTGLALRPADGLEPGTLVVMMAFEATSTEPRNYLADQWQQMHPDIPVEFEYVHGEPDDQFDQMVKDASRDRKADVYVLDIVWMERFIRDRYIRALDMSGVDQKDLGDFVPKVLTTGVRNNTYWSLPFNTDTGIIFYRSDIIPGAWQPQAWGDIFGAPAKKAAGMAHKKHPEIATANAAQIEGNEMLTISALESIWAARGNFVTPDGKIPSAAGDKVQFTPQDLAGVEALVDAAKDKKITLPLGDEAGAVESFADQKEVLFMRNWPIARDQIANRVPYGVTEPPFESVLGGQNLAVAADTGKPRSAQALIEFLTSSQSQLLLAELGGYVPTRSSALTRSKWPHSSAVRESLNNARLRPITPCYVEFSKFFRTGIYQALNSVSKTWERSFPTELAKKFRCE